MRCAGTAAITWEHVRHEEAAAFAAAAEAALTGELAVCAGSCGPGNLHLINGLYDANRSRVPVLAIAAHIPAGRDRRRVLPGDASAGAVPRVQRVLRAGQHAGADPARHGDRDARGAGSAAGSRCVVVPGEVFFADARTPGASRSGARGGLGDPAGRRLRSRPRREVLNAREPGDHPGRGRMRGRARPAHRRSRAPCRRRSCTPSAARSSSSTTTRFDVGMTGLIGFSSGYRAMEHCDALVMLGTDFPYRPFFPEGVPVIQVDVRGENIGRRVPVDCPARRHGQGHRSRRCCRCSTAKSDGRTWTG